MDHYLRPRILQPLALVLLCSCGSNLFQPDHECGVEDQVVRDLTVGNADGLSALGEEVSTIRWSVKVEDVCVGEPPALGWSLSMDSGDPTADVEAWVSYGIRALTIPASRTEVGDTVRFDAVHTLGMDDQFDGSAPGEFTIGLTVLFEAQGSRTADSLYLASILYSGTVSAVYRRPFE